MSRCSLNRIHILLFFFFFKGKNGRIAAVQRRYRAVKGKEKERNSEFVYLMTVSNDSCYVIHALCVFDVCVYIGVHCVV